MSWKQKTSNSRASSLESSGLFLCWLVCTRYQAHKSESLKKTCFDVTVSLKFWSDTDSKSWVHYHILPKYWGPILGHVIHPPPSGNHGAKGSMWICFVWIWPWFSPKWRWKTHFSIIVHPQNHWIWMNLDGGGGGSYSWRIDHYH